MHSSSKAAFKESYRALADVLSLPRRHEPEVNVLALVRDWLQRDDICPWLMVVDNAGHFLHVDQREVVEKLILEFYEGVCGSESSDLS